MMQNGNAGDKQRIDGGPDESVAKTLIDSFATELAVAGHAMVADEPAGRGGTGLGPSPYDFLSAALASCTSMTLKMYASRRSLPLKSVTVHVRHDKLHVEDCADCESESSRVDEFRREISLEGDLDDGQRERLLEIANKCPVHRTLESKVRIRTALVGAAASRE